MKTQILRKYVKLVAVMTLSLLCSHLWAQGSEGTGQWFRINLNDEAKTSVHIMLSTTNGKHSIKSGMVPSKKAEGYTAFFVSDDGKYYIYEHDTKKNIINDWMEAGTDIKNQAGLEKIYSYVKDLDFSIISDNGETYLKNVGYKEIDRTALAKPFRTKNNGFDSMSIYNKKNGIFVLAVYPEKGKKNVKIISFRDTKSFAEVNKDPALLESFIEWLKKSDNDKIKDVNLQIYVKVAQLIYKQLDECRKSVDQYRKYKFLRLYVDEGNIPLRRYIQLAAKENKSVFYNDLLPEIANKYMAITKNEGDLFANKILNVEYSKGDIKQLIKDTMIDCKIWNKRDSSFDLEKHSIVVSDVSEARKGDVVLFESYAEDQNNNQKVLKIDYAVIAENVVCNEVYGTNQTNSLGSISVYKLKEKIGNNKKKYEREIYQFSELWNDKNKAPECVEIRRLLKQNNSNDIQSLENIAWNLFNTSIDPTSSKIEIGIMWESTQQSQNTKYRWIPNTGEYLILEQLKLTAKNIIGQSINGNNWKVILCGARDRYWEEDKSNASEYGNIYNNSECKFEIQVGDKNGELSKKSDSENYSIKWYKDKDKLIEDDGPEFDIKTENNLLYYGSDSLQINIRPENAKNVRPGDDLLLTFKIINNNETATNKKIEDAEVTVSDNDYIAVYDKKMLWRANLYINESNNDWNDEHPWNAPSDAEHISGTWGDKNNVETCLLSWDEKNWGYNEWNKSIERNKEGNIIFNSSNGKQTVDYGMFEFHSARSQADNSPIIDRVSYDYDRTDIYTNEGNGNVSLKTIVTQAMDSPFDFVYKLYEQNRLINKYFTRTGINSNDIASFPNHKNNGVIPLDSESSLTNKNVSETQSALAPYNLWHLYLKNNYSVDNQTFKAYIPGLGLFFHTPVHQYNSKLPNNKEIVTVNTSTDKVTIYDFKINFPALMGAGTDCIGFVQRTQSYRNTSEPRTDNRVYKWGLLPSDTAEASGDVVTPEFDKKREEICSYPKDSVSSLIISRNEIKNNVNYFKLEYGEKESTERPSETKFLEIKDKFLRILPGDVIYYKTDGKYSHIGEICSVNYDVIQSARKITDLMDAISIIESVYEGHINYVIIRTMVEGGDVFKKNANSSWHLDGSGKLRDWEIRRLK